MYVEIMWYSKNKKPQSCEYIYILLINIGYQNINNSDKAMFFYRHGKEIQDDIGQEPSGYFQKGRGSSELGVGSCDDDEYPIGHVTSKPRGKWEGYCVTQAFKQNIYILYVCSTNYKSEHGVKRFLPKIIFPQPEI